MSDIKRSTFALKAKEINDLYTKEIGSFDENKASVLFYILKEDMGLSNCKVDVFYEETPKRIVIHSFDSNNNEVFIKPKKVSALDDLSKFLGIDEYKIEFARSVG